ncbi:MAG: hypothetical protein AB8C95_05110 [Phycisphaeraceae bacterium]
MRKKATPKINVFCILLYIVSGFFVYTAGLLSFLSAPIEVKWTMVAVFLAIATVFLLCGLSLNRFGYWKRHAGVVLVSGAGVALFCLFTLAMMFQSEEFLEQLEEANTTNIFTDYISGGLFVCLIAACGAGLILADRPTKQAITPQDS